MYFVADGEVVRLLVMTKANKSMDVDAALRAACREMRYAPSSIISLLFDYHGAYCGVVYRTHVGLANKSSSLPGFRTSMTQETVSLSLRLDPALALASKGSFFPLRCDILRSIVDLTQKEGYW